MAGKSVRCKQCGEIFRIDAGEVGLDLDALSQSISGEELPTHQGTAHRTAVGGPSLDEHGRPSIERPDDVEAFSVRAHAAAGPRSNFRFRYPGAKAVDRLLPWALVALAFGLVGSASMTVESSLTGPPPTGVGISRMVILFAAYILIVFPASHIAMKMAATRMRFSLPSAAVWRSFAAFSPLLMMGGWLFIKSEGGAVPLVLGLFVGALLSVGAVVLLFRVFLNEVGIVAGYTIIGTVGSSFFAALTIFAINLIAVSLARMDKNPTLFTSPIAIGLDWVEKPATPVAIAPKKPAANATPANTTAPVIEATPPPPPPPTVNASPLTPLPLPKPEEGQPQLLKSLQQAPIVAGFDLLLMTPVESNALAVVRTPAGGAVEVWDRSSWRQPIRDRGRGFDINQGALVVNTSARHVYRMVRTPNDRLEEIRLGNVAPSPPIVFAGSASNRSLLGFVNEDEVIVRSYDNGGMALERYNVATGAQVYPPTPFTNVKTDENGQIMKDSKGQPTLVPMLVEMHPSTMRMLPDGSGVLLACRDPSAPDSPARLALYAAGKFDKPIAVRDAPVPGRSFRPLGMAVRSSGRVALLLDAAGEGYFTLWEMRGATTADGAAARSKKPLLDFRLGILSELRPPTWDDNVDPLLWFDEDTLLIYGRLLLDARTGRQLGTLDIPNITAHFRNGDGSVLLVQSQNNIATLLVATTDAEALAKARAQ